MAQQMGKGSGWSLDISTEDANGRAWDFNDPACRQRARELQKKTRPLLLVLSPMCKYFSGSDVDDDVAELVTFPNQVEFVEG